MWFVPDPEHVFALAQSAGDQASGLTKFYTVISKKMVQLDKKTCVAALDYTEKDSKPDDLIKLRDVNQATILHCTRLRFSDRLIYTSMGTVLMSVNPFEMIPGLYGTDVIQRYINQVSNPPHVYSVAFRAYQAMCSSKKNQSLLISGESGAGKTEAAKNCLALLTSVSGTANSSNGDDAAAAAAGGGSSGTTVEATKIAKRILACSPLLEAFGNAQTVRNPNSSRFGKWMELNFDQNNNMAVCGSNVVSYLLEKSRVTSRDYTRERNFHVFYQILRGGNIGILASLHLDPNPTQYVYLVGHEGNAEQPKDLGDKKGYKEMLLALNELGFTQESTLAILKVIACILLLGNIQFVAQDEGEASGIVYGESGVGPKHVAELLSVDADELAFSICNRKLHSGKGGRSVTMVKLSVAKAQDTRDSLARALYDRVFRDIIDRFNENNAAANASSNESGGKNRHEKHLCIGLLDIFGFEILKENSFEQLCINYCNEMLQSHFNFVVFTAEQTLYATEGITCDSIEFKDNLPVIKEIEGMFKSLDEEGRIPKGTFKTWFDKAKRAANAKGAILFSARKDVFNVKHYAGSVEYSPVGFIDKNIETLNHDLIDLMSSSKDRLIHRLFDNGKGKEAAAAIEAGDSLTTSEGSGGGGGGGGSDPSDSHDGSAPGPAKSSSIESKRGPSSSSLNRSIARVFQDQLESLMSMLRETESHFIRCVKSNDECRAMVFDAPLVHKQLLYSGVFEVVKIQQSGLPCRFLHAEFMDKFRCLAPSSSRWRFNTPKELLQCLRARKMELPEAQMGRTMTFYKTFEQRLLEQAREVVLRDASTKIQAWVRSVIFHHLFLKFRTVVRQLIKYISEFNLEQANEYLLIVKAQVKNFVRILKFKTLAFLQRNFEQSVQILVDQVAVLKDLTDSRDVRSVAGFKRLSELIVRAEKLKLASNPLVEECRVKTSRYQEAVDYVALFAAQQYGGNDNGVTGLAAAVSISSIIEGIAILGEFRDVIAAAESSISRAENSRFIIVNEIATLYDPLMRAFVDAALEYDENTHTLRPRKGGDSLASLAPDLNTIISSVASSSSSSSTSSSSSSSSSSSLSGR